MMETFTDIGRIAAQEGVSVAVGINRDLIEADSLSAAFYRETKNSEAFNLIFECSRNLAGYSKDVHGQLNVI